MPLISDVHVDQPLSNFAVEYSNEAFIARRVMPVVTVDKKSDLYWEYNKKNKFQLPETIRGPKDVAKEIDWAVTTSSYKAIDNALREFTPDALTGNADAGMAPREKSTEILKEALDLRLEYEVSQKVFSSANFATGYKKALTGGDRLDKYGTSDPVGVIDDGKDALFYDPNLMVLGKAVWKKLKRHPKILENIKGGADTDNPSITTLRLIAELFEIETVIVGRSRYNSANAAQDGSYSNLWGKHILLAYVDPNPSLSGVSAYKSFFWNQYSTGLEAAVRTYREEQRGGGGEWVEVEQSYDLVEVCSDLAYLIYNAVN